MIQINKPAPAATGRFSEKPLAHILVYILGRQLGGSLEVGENGATTTVYFQEGRPAKIRTDFPGNEVGSILVELGHATDDQVEAAVSRASTTSALIGEILTVERTIEPRHLVEALKIQMMRKMVSLFGMTDAPFAFYEGVNLLRADTADELFPVDTYAVLLAGLREFGDKLDLTKMLGSLQGCYVAVPEVATLKRLRSVDQERVICAQLSGAPKSFDAMWSDPNIDRAALTRLLYVLLITKELKVEQQAPVVRQSQPPAPEVSAALLDSTLPGEKDGEVPAEVTALRDKVQQKAAAMASQDYFAMLEIEKGASPEEARKAYFSLAKEYHPDKLAKVVGRGYIDTLQYVFSNISEAHVTLADPASYEEYMSMIDGGHAEDEEARAEVAAVLQAENAFQKALVLLRREQFVEALRFVDQAVAGQPQEGEYTGIQAYLGWKTDPETTSASMAIEKLRGALEKHPKSIRLRLFIGTVLQSEGRRNEARDHYQTVLRTKPNNVEAARALRYLDVLEKREEGSASKGLMGIIFGKKS